jgi:hypothetical protein
MRHEKASEPEPTGRRAGAGGAARAQGFVIDEGRKLEIDAPPRHRLLAPHS